MTKKENNINVLDEINKGACMGMDAIKYILDKVEDEQLKKFLEHQYSEYKTISDKICDIYPEYSKKEPHETGAVTKMMTWSGINMKTLTDQSTSKIAELLMQGTNMGIIEGRKLLNHKDTESNVLEIIEEYISMQEKMVERLKEFL